MRTITPNDIKVRSKNNNMVYTNRNNGYINHARTVFDKVMESTKFQQNNTDFCLNNWDCIGTDIDESVKCSLDLFENICEKCNNPGYLNKAANIISEQIIPKARNGVETQNYIKGKIGRFKTKLSTKVKGKVQTSTDAVKTALGDQLPSAYEPPVSSSKISSSPSVGVTSNDNSVATSDTSTIKSEYFERFYDEASIIVNCDRVLKNYNMISNRFNIDRVLSESIDMQDFMNTFSSLVDTYNISTKNKFIIATETALFALDKNHIDYTKRDILNYSVDYYLMTENCESDQIKSALNNMAFFDTDDAKDLQYITELDPESEDKYDHTICENSYGITDLDSIHEEDNKVGETAKDIWNGFKKLPNKTIDGMKSCITKIYARSPEQILEEIPNILSILRMTFVVGGAFAIHPVVGIVTFIADQWIAHGMKRNETAKILNSYKDEKSKAEEKLSTLTDDESISRTKEYIKTINSNIDKIDNYYSGLLTDKENSERRVKDKSSTSTDYDLGFDDFSFDEDAIIEPINEMNFANTVALSLETLKKNIVKMNDKQKAAAKSIDIATNNFKKAAEQSIVKDNREAIIKGSLLPSASQVLKLSLVAGASALIMGPAMAVIEILGYIGCRSSMQAKERQMVLDEIEIELKMVERYLKVAEDNNDLEAQRQLLKTQRNLERQHQRIKYKMKVKFNQDTGESYYKKRDEDNN